jgi:dihydroorotase-like cyclic amidohydrolase
MWHIRKASDLGPFYGGGIDTPSLCERVRPISARGQGGWDLPVEVTPHHLTMNTCDICRKAYEELAKR